MLLRTKTEIQPMSETNVGANLIAIWLCKPSEILVPTLCVGMHMGRSVSPERVSRSSNTEGRRASRIRSHEERVGTRGC